MKKIIKLISLLFVFFIAFIFPVFDFEFDVPTILTSIALLFTILIGFFIAAATSNYLNLQSNIAKEDSYLIHVYGLVRIIDPSLADKISQAIDNYMIASLDYEFLEYAAETNKEFEKVVKIVDEVSASAATENQLVQNLQETKAELLLCRTESMMASQKIVTKKHWFILGTLSVIIAILLMSFRDGTFFLSLLIGMINLTILQTLSLLFEIDANMFLADKIGYGNEPQSVFRGIGQPAYYPEKALQFIKKRDLVGKYRVGYYRNYPATLDKEIKLVEGQEVKE